MWREVQRTKMRNSISTIFLSKESISWRIIGLIRGCFSRALYRLPVQSVAAQNYTLVLAPYMQSR